MTAPAGAAGPVAGRATGSDSSASSTAPVRFSTAEVQPCERFAYWNDCFGSLHDVAVDRDHRPGFDAVGLSWRLGPILIADFVTPARQVVRDLKRLRSDDLDHIVLRVALDGPMQCRTDDTRLVVPPGEVVLSTYARSYDDALPAGRWITAICDRDAVPAFWGWSGTPRHLQGGTATLLAAFLTTLPATLRAMTPDAMPHIAETVRLMITSCLAGCVLPETPSLGHESAALRQKVDRIIAVNLPSPRLTPARIAELAGVSRSTLYRIFEADGGIAALVLRRRLALVQRDLEAPSLVGLGVAALAERHGLYNAAAFHRSFRRHFGQTPGAYQANALASHRSRLPARQADSHADGQFIDLLRPARPGPAQRHA